MSNEKYFNRSGFSISRDPSSIERSEKEPDWFKDYVAAMEKASAKSRSSIFDQISGILGGKNKFSTVEEVVQDMAKRTGLSQMLKNKQASVGSGKFDNIEIFKEIPEMKTYIDNFIEDRPGTSVESVIHDMSKNNAIKGKLPDGDLPLDVKLYINDKLFQAKQDNPDSIKENMNIGKVDMQVDDNLANENNPFQGCEPKGDSR